MIEGENLNAVPRVKELDQVIFTLPGVPARIGSLVAKINDAFSLDGDALEKRILEIFNTEITGSANRIFDDAKKKGIPCSAEHIEGKMKHFLAFYTLQNLFSDIGNSPIGADGSNANENRVARFLTDIKEAPALPFSGERMTPPVVSAEVLLSNLVASPELSPAYPGISHDAHMVDKISEEYPKARHFLPQVLQILGDTIEYGVQGREKGSELMYFYFFKRMEAGVITVCTDGAQLSRYLKGKKGSQAVKEYMDKWSISKDAMNLEYPQIIRRSLLALHPLSLTQIAVHRASFSDAELELIEVPMPDGKPPTLMITTKELRSMILNGDKPTLATVLATIRASSIPGEAAVGCPMGYSHIMAKAIEAVAFNVTRKPLLS